MTSEIWKYELEITDGQIIDMPRNAEILCVQMQHGKPCLWAVVVPSVGEMAGKEPRRIRIIGTGHPFLDEGLKYIGTFMANHDRFVGHVFEETQ